MLIISEPITKITEVDTITHDVTRINSIKKKYSDYRDESKGPTFALTYQGTQYTLVKNCGFSIEKANKIFYRYNELYKVSVKWVEDKLLQATKDGYITGAFGLRVRTPLLHKVVFGTKQTPYEATAEGRTAGNALGQSWCLLNSRAWAAALEQIRASKYKHDIKPCAQIHDAGYVLIKDDLDTLMYLNEVIVKEVQWNDHPDIYHENVGLGGELSVYYPSWENEIGIPNGASKEQILAIVEKVLNS